MNTEYPTTETMREYRADIEDGIRDAYARALECERIPQRWTSVCRINKDGVVSLVDGNTSSNYIWDADGWRVVAEFDTDASESLDEQLKEALEHFRREI